MKKITQYIPNTITCLNLTSGIYACISGLSGDYPLAMLFVFIAAVLDFMDGWAARIFKAYSPIGKELDSLADLVSFGVAPGLTIYSLFEIFSFGIKPDSPLSANLFQYIVPVIIPSFSALRLAKFNIDENQKTSFLGLAVPANAIFWVSFVNAFSSYDFTFKNGLSGFSFQNLFMSMSSLLSLSLLTVIVVIMSLLLVSRIPMFSFKISSFEDNTLVFVFLILTVFLVLVFGTSGFWMSIVLYILLSILFFK
jgi:CDP-diacylglycerol--serine O-phosphatidyltransferase